MLCLRWGVLRLDMWALSFGSKDNESNETRSRNSRQEFVADYFVNNSLLSPAGGGLAGNKEQIKQSLIHR